jgi:hypothetical protein
MDDGTPIRLAITIDRAARTALLDFTGGRFIAHTSKNNSRDASVDYAAAISCVCTCRHWARGVRELQCAPSGHVLRRYLLSAVPRGFGYPPEPGLIGQALGCLSPALACSHFPRIELLWTVVFGALVPA